MTSKIKLPSPTQTIIYLTVIYVIGIVGMLTEGTRSLFIWLVPINILMAVMITALYHQPYNLRFVISCLAVYLGGFIVEWAGVETGLIFGEYIYNGGLGWKVVGVPPIMGLNWLLLVYGSIAIASRLFKKKYMIALSGALLMVLYDVFLEPSAINYHFWTWENGLIPIQNYLAWFLCAFVFIGIFLVTIQIEIKNKVAEAVFWLQMAFFGIIWIANNLMA